MNKKILIASLFATLMLLVPMTSAVGVSVAHENMLIKNIQPSIEVIIEVTGNGRTFHITTYISNNGDEQVTLMLLGMPGGGFEIYNQNEEMVYRAPQFVLLIVWELTLEPGQIVEMFSNTWKGVDNDWKNLPSGNYSVRGFVLEESGDIFSEPVNIYLEKAKSKNILRLLERFPNLFPILRLLIQRLGLQ